MTDTTTTVHGADLGGYCRCGNHAPSIPDGLSDAEAVAEALDQLFAHYAAVGWEPAAPVIPTMTVGPANRITSDDEQPGRIPLPDVVERIAAKAAAATADDVDDVDIAELRFQARWEAFAPTAMFDGAVLDDLAPDVRAEVDRWLDSDPEGPRGNLIISGTLGIGKSYTGIAICHALMRRGHTARWGPVAEILDRLRPGGDLEVEHLTRPDYLFLDDLGADRATDWATERLYVVINRRWLERRPLIVTTNSTTEQIVEQIGARSWDRIRDGAVGIEMTGESRRRPR